MYDTERIREEDPKYLMLYPERERPMNKLLEAISRAAGYRRTRIFPAYRNKTTAPLKAWTLRASRSSLESALSSETLNHRLRIHLYNRMEGENAYHGRENVHQPVAHVRHSPWLSKPCQNPKLIGVQNCADWSGISCKMVSISGIDRDDEKWSPKKVRMLLLVDSYFDLLTAKSCDALGLERYLWPFLPFLSTKVCVARNTWYIPALRRGTCCLRLPAILKEGEKCVT